MRLSGWYKICIGTMYESDKYSNSTWDRSMLYIITYYFGEPWGLVNHGMTCDLPPRIRRRRRIDLILISSMTDNTDNIFIKSLFLYTRRVPRYTRYKDIWVWMTVKNRFDQNGYHASYISVWRLYSKYYASITIIHH